MRDPLAASLGALACGVGLGSACLTLTLLLVRAVQGVELARYGETVSDSSLELMVGVGAAIVVAAVFAWRRSAAIERDVHRAAIATLAAFGALTVAFLLAIRAERLAGRAGLVSLALACTALGLLGGRWALKGAGGGKGDGGGSEV